MSEGARSVGSEQPWQTLTTSKKYGGRFSGPGRPFSPVSPPPSLTDGKVVSEERPSSPAGSNSSGYVSYRSSAGVGNGRPYSPFRSLSPTERPFASVQGGAAGEDSPFSAASSGSESTFTFPERNTRLTRSWSQSSGPGPSLLDAAPRYESQLQSTYGRIRPRTAEAPVIQPQSLPVGGASRKSSSSSVDFNSLRKISDFTPPQPPPKPVTHTSTLRLKVGDTIERERDQKPDGKDFAMPESGLKYGVGGRKPYGTPYKAESEPLKPRVFNVEYDRLLSSSSTTASDDDAAAVPPGAKKGVLNGSAPKDELLSSREQRDKARMKFFSSAPGTSETVNKLGGVHQNANHEELQLHEPVKGKAYNPTYGKINRKETKAQKVVPQPLNSNVNSYAVRESSKYRTGGKVPPMASPESYYEDEEYRDYGKINKPAAQGPPPTPPPPPPPVDSDDDNHRIMAELERMELKTTSRAQPVRNVREYSERGVLVQEVDEGQPCLECGEKCSGFTPHVWRKTCSSCKCPREAHDVYHEEWVNVSERLGFKLQADSERRASRERSINEGYAWVPPRLTSAQIEKYFAELPPEKVPELGTTGEKYHSKQLTIQLPRQDLALAYCKHVESQHHSSYEDFISARNEIALDFGYVCESEGYTECPQCQKAIGPLELGVVAPKFGDRTMWHPSCFICTTCKELLVDLTYCVHDDLIYCERHYAEQLKPRCAACDELIFSGEYTKAMSKDWHSGHFSCWQCDESLTGQRYVLRDDHPYCIKCYESVFANTCEECNKTIGIDSKDLSYKDKHWHEACFLCHKCRVSLVDKQFGSKADKIYCGNCYDAQFASRCDGCGEIFRAGTKKMEYKTRQWHEKCFCCVVCKTAIGTKSFIPREQEIYCATCYEEKFATRCVKCNKIITSGGVTYKNEPWHRECFTCTNCNTSLAGQRFTSRDEKPYCADCFGELFAKRCTSCSRPITGIGGTRFISFEDRHWHNDCFICALCKTSLVGRGFITDGDDIICPECAKQKLM